MSLKRFAITGTVIATGLAGLWGYWQYTVRHPETEDAYVNAHIVQVTPQASGEVVQLAIRDQQTVARGDILFEIGRKTLIAERAQAEAHLAQVHNDIAADAAAVDAAQAEVHRQEVLLKNAEARAARVDRVVKRGGLSTQEGDDADAELNSARAQLALAQARLHEAEVKRGPADSPNPRVQAIEADIRRIDIDLGHTTVVAPCDGQAENVTLHPGDVVTANRAVFALVCNDGFWVEANFKETQLAYLRVGQPANVRLDMYPDHPLQGTVESISRASGVTFSLLPPENATGNWVKVTQRIPVRIHLPDTGTDLPLRIGSSATVTVDTTAQP